MNAKTAKVLRQFSRLNKWNYKFIKKRFLLRSPELQKRDIIGMKALISGGGEIHGKTTIV